tara:strand:- start:236 stop:871 length:636 start_codon:yes stop_codon:yes gene_type:complete
MKKIFFLISIIPMLAFGQIPVTDAAANATLGMINSQLLQTNMQIKSMGVQLTTMNQNLDRLISLLKKNNNLTSKSKEILKEELEAKKTAPDYVMKSTEVITVVNLKNKILKAYRTSQQSVRAFENLDKEESKEFFSYVANAVMKTTDLFKQCKTILYTRSIIQPEERLKKIDQISIKLTEIFDNLIAYEKKLKQINSTRDIRKTLIDLNKN